MDQVSITTGGYTRLVDYSVAKRIKVETRIAKCAIHELLAAGYLLGVFDGEEHTIRHSKDKKAILDAMQTTDDDYLMVYKLGLSERFGWMRFVYGNDGWDVISDYTTNLEESLVQTMALVDRLQS